MWSLLWVDIVVKVDCIWVFDVFAAEDALATAAPGHLRPQIVFNICIIQWLCVWKEQELWMYFAIVVEFSGLKIGIRGLGG